MYRAGGIAYVYLIYGMHHCLNVVIGNSGYPAAVLIRGAESPAEAAEARGPGRLTRVFEVDRALDGASFAGRELWLEEGEPFPDRDIRRTPRIGVDYAGIWARRRFRFIVRGHPGVS
jgi:DNA-3-methyladenine glycosylase